MDERRLKTERIDAFPRTGAAGTGCQVATVAVGRSDSEDRSAAVAKSCPGTLMPRRPDERQTEARHVGGGLEAGLGTQSVQLIT